MRAAMTPDAPVPRSHARKLFRALTFSCAFFASAALVFRGAVRAVELAEAPGIPLSLNLVANTNDFVRRLAAAQGPDRIAFVGDSTCMTAQNMTDPAHEVLPARIGVAMRQYGKRARRANLIPMCVPGLGPSGMYFVSERIIAAHPDRVVLALNLRGFNTESMHAFGYAEVAGGMTPEQFLTSLRLPLFSVGLTLDRLLLYKGLFALDVVPQWVELRQLQGRLFNAHEPFARWLEAQLGSKPTADMQFDLGIARLMRSQIPDKDRQSRQMAERGLGPVLNGLGGDADNLRFLGAALERFRAAGIPTLVYVEPTNLEHLRSLGLSVDRVQDSITAIANTVKQGGALLADFHALFPDAAFRDPGDHYTFSGATNGTNWLGDRIALAIVRDLLPAVPASEEHAVQ
jgi:hypothetical protein